MSFFNITAHVLCINQTKANIHGRIIMARLFCFLLSTKSILTEYSKYLLLHCKCINAHICMYLCVLFCLWKRHCSMYIWAEWVWCMYVNCCSAQPTSHMQTHIYLFLFTKLTACFNTGCCLCELTVHCRKTVEGSIALQSLTSRGRPFQSGQARGHFCGCMKPFFGFRQMMSM